MNIDLQGLFKTSSAWDEIKLVQNIRKWQDSKYMPLWSGLPKSFRFSSDFWEKAMSIHRYTEADKKEHAISVWSIYNQVIITEVTRGTESQVTTQDRIQVKFDPIPAKKAYLRRIFVNGKEREKSTIPLEKIPKTQKDAELRYLFNVHAHPPHDENIQKSYSYYSSTDLNSFIASKAIITGLVTDKVSILFKTRQTPNKLNLDDNTTINPEYIRDTLRIAEYKADFTYRLFVLQEMPEAK